MFRLGFFDLFEATTGIIFLAAVGLIAFVAVRGIKQWDRNNRSPRLTVEARVVAKRTHVSQMFAGAGPGASMSAAATYYVTFQVESGDRAEFSLPGTEYGRLAEGDRGRLTFQGTRYLGFERM